MFERFTDRARRAITLAQEEARMLYHNYIGTEHILLGLIHEGQGVAAVTLETAGISLEGVRSQVEEIIGIGPGSPSGHIPFTPRAKEVLELSLREALQLGHNYIGTEHILLGLIREGEGVAAQVLIKLGAELSKTRLSVIEIISGYQQALSTQRRTQEEVLRNLDTQIAEVRRQMEAAINSTDFTTASTYRDKEKALCEGRRAIENAKSTPTPTPTPDPITITASTAADNGWRTVHQVGTGARAMVRLEKVAALAEQIVGDGDVGIVMTSIRGITGEEILMVRESIEEICKAPDFTDEDERQEGPS